MPVTLQTSTQTPTNWKPDSVQTAERLLRYSCPEEYKRCKQIIQSSFTNDRDGLTKHINPNSNGFVNALFRAYSDHHHPTIRPDDAWIAILTQLSFYIKSHAKKKKKLRSFFVSHVGKKKLVVYVDEPGTIFDVDVGKIAIKMTELMQKFVNDEQLREWFLPSFMTTSDNDRVVAAVVMMGSLQEYFRYDAVTSCGIPSVTLLGDRSDWVELEAKLDKIWAFGKEPSLLFASLLKPVLRSFVASFDHPDSTPILEFWGQSVHHDRGSGYDYLSGWITTFCFWDIHGKCLYNREGLKLAGRVFLKIDIKDIPPAFPSVPVEVKDLAGRRDYNTFMVAGLVGIEATSTPSPTDPAPVGS